MEVDKTRLQELLPPVCEIAAQAGEAILKIYRQGFDIEGKSDHSPLTTADVASHELISERLRKLTPEIPVLSEESGTIPYRERAAWRSYWLVDPLDGTREFIKRNDEFTVNIALITDRRVILGVVYLPTKKVCYFAAEGSGAFKRRGGEPARGIHTRPSTPNGIPTVCASRSIAGRSLRALLARIGKYKLISVGSSIKTCLVAEGTADIYPRFGMTYEWDTAAPQCVLQEAGGRLVDQQLLPLRYNTKDSLLNPAFIAVGDINDEWRTLLTAPMEIARDYATTKHNVGGT